MFRQPLHSPFRRKQMILTGIATVTVTPTGQGKKHGYGSAEATVTIYATATPKAQAVIRVSETGQGTKTSEHLYFIEEPQIVIQEYAATHVTVKSPTASYMASLEEIADERRVDRLVEIDSGDEEVCQEIAEELLTRWGREQVTISGAVPFTVVLNFKQKVRIIIPSAGIDEELVLQRKEHILNNYITNITCGDIMLSDDELLARLLEKVS